MHIYIALTLHTVTQEQEDPNKFRVFEIYKSPAAFEEHHSTTFTNMLLPYMSTEGVLVAAPVIAKHELLEDVEKGIVAP
jgi:quinol monooxygenase YgiN